MALPFLAISDNQGNIYIHPYLRLAVKSWDRIFLPEKKDLIPIPEGTIFYSLPDRIAVGYNVKTGRFEDVASLGGRQVWPLSCFLPPAYLRLYLPASRLKKQNYKKLPLWSYTAVGWYGGRFYAAAMRVDNRRRQSPRFYENIGLEQKVSEKIKRYPQNRLYRHLATCALNYNCLAAKNLFLGRWEAPLPVSPVCNSRCLGCLSFQAKGSFCPSQQRIKFVPTPEEIVEVAVPHLEKAKEPIVSFGQGCEGEPLLQVAVIEKAIRLIRKKTCRGTIHINTNASIPDFIKRLCSAGIDSIRVSLNSASEELYNCYFRPKNYSLKDVISSIKISRQARVFVSINLLVFPGFTDREHEVKGFLKLVKNTKINMVQLRNLNIDPDYYQNNMPELKGEILGLSAFVELLIKSFPEVKTGYFNICV